MKKITVVTIALFLGAFVAFGATPNGDKENRKVRKKVENLLENPYFLGESKTLTTSVEFLVNQKGEVVVIDVDSDNESVVYFIKSRLNYQKIVQNPEKFAQRRYYLPVTLVINS